MRTAIEMVYICRINNKANRRPSSNVENPRIAFRRWKSMFKKMLALSLVTNGLLLVGIVVGSRICELFIRTSFFRQALPLVALNSLFLANGTVAYFLPLLQYAGAVLYFKRADPWSRLLVKED